MSLQPLKPITLMGANASGKTEIALELARRLGGEIISADSKQIYKSLEAGTAKPHGSWTKTEAGKFYLVDGIPYHMVDTLNPRATYDAGSFVKEAKKLVPEIWARRKVPLMAGGTGMYVQAFWNGMDILPGADPVIRAELAAVAESRGREALHAELASIDPAAALRIPPGNIQRVMRAIEITRLAGRPVSQIWSGRFFNALPVHEGKFIFIKWQKDLLAERVKRRTAERFEQWAAETRELTGNGYAADCPGLKTLGYPQILDYLAGRITKPDAIRFITAASMAYAKRQNTWFGRYRNATLLELKSFKDYDPAALAEKILNL
ncbi:MAG: tRNA (adenosine(37)-N6)-dimethylallyltransferase MiaA [Elusimicrobia bacterium CG_4_10_14_0_2_um_filter_56_8]|nr:MAG: tRNA (adenosine(37)-N6)-dimethylallyltransferase MiaA [Elusimicrobia bacterium CG1_02_56_21]PJA16839.1 MAG: tRNA (adenosine(37)-N6)-dimethylallyltransferase MiaA [Elusimicrobia bacterium CG_4_10_14_0_2_um_filter_56_8]